MKQLKKVMIGTCLIAAMATAVGCSYKQIELSEMPKPVENKQNINVIELDKLKALLPKDAEILKLTGSAADSGIIFIDLDKDSKDEMLAAYKISGNLDETHVIVLKNQDNEWIKLFDIKGAGHTVDYMSTAKILGNGNKQLLIGWAVGASAGNLLEVYDIAGEKPEELFEKGYHKLEVADFASVAEADNKDEMAIWTKDSGDAFAVDVFRWHEGSLVQAGDTYQKYFDKVEAYYKERISKQPDAAIYWYYLADAQFKMARPQDALKSIEEGLKLNSEYPDKEKFLKLQELINSGC